MQAHHPTMTPDTASQRFDREAQEWDQRPTSLQLAPVPGRLLAQVRFGARDHVLDFGAGTGLLATAVAAQVARVTALDTSAGMLAVLRDKGLTNIDTLEQDIFEGLPGRYDAIVSCMALHHVADTAGLFREFARALVPGGQIALVDLYAEDGSFHGDNVAKGVQHFGFEPAVLEDIAHAAGLRRIGFSEIVRVHRSTGRSYPLFLMTGRRDVGAVDLRTAGHAP